MSIPDLDITEIECNESQKNLLVIQEMINNKEDVYILFQKVIDEMSGNYKKFKDLINKVHNERIARSTRLNEQ